AKQSSDKIRKGFFGKDGSLNKARDESRTSARECGVMVLGIVGDDWCFDCKGERSVDGVCTCEEKGRCDMNVFASSVHGMSASPVLPFQEDSSHGPSREHKVSVSFCGQRSPCVWFEETEDQICGWCRVCGCTISGMGVGGTTEKREASLFKAHVQNVRHKFFRAMHILVSGLEIVKILVEVPDYVVGEFAQQLRFYATTLRSSADAVSLRDGEPTVLLKFIDTLVGELDVVSESRAVTFEEGGTGWFGSLDIFTHPNGAEEFHNTLTSVDPEVEVYSRSLRSSCLALQGLAPLLDVFPDSGPGAFSSAGF
ncbi:hypothetical protein T484DRAFT_1983669, partial [Baffinella frigidus]